MTIPSVYVELDFEQLEDMEWVIGLAKRAAEDGKPGMILAQMLGSGMRVFFADYTQACGIQAAMGMPVGKTTADYRRERESGQT